MMGTVELDDLLMMYLGMILVVGTDSIVLLAEYFIVGVCGFAILKNENREKMMRFGGQRPTTSQRVLEVPNFPHSSYGSRFSCIQAVMCVGNSSVIVIRHLQPPV